MVKYNDEETCFQVDSYPVDLFLLFFVVYSGLFNIF